MKVVLSGPALGATVGCLLSVTTFLYLNHDRDTKEWDHRRTVAERSGYWSPPTADFNWCESDYAYTPWIMELWNSLTSLAFCVGPTLLWAEAHTWEVQLNLLLVAAIGLGSAAFHATLLYETQLLDELPMICYIAHTTALLARQDVRCPRVLQLALALLVALLFGTPRDAAAHECGRVVMVLAFSGCFVWLAFSVAGLCAELDRREARGSGWYQSCYQYGSLAVLVAIVAWICDNLACKDLHSLPFGLPYPQLHATVWHFGMAYVCHCLCLAVLGKTRLYSVPKSA